MQYPIYWQFGREHKWGRTKRLVQRVWAPFFMPAIATVYNIKELFHNVWCFCILFFNIWLYRQPGFKQMKILRQERHTVCFIEFEVNSVDCFLCFDVELPYSSIYQDTFAKHNLYLPGRMWTVRPTCTIRCRVLWFPVQAL